MELEPRFDYFTRNEIILRTVIIISCYYDLGGITIRLMYCQLLLLVSQSPSYTGSYGPPSGYAQRSVRACSPESFLQSITPTPTSEHSPV
jgi:hypothetical protein